ncbi:hypothetical protein [Microbacterium sp.]|uniref:hypothetical protein n=1 Tax=Microbacterium sp. TaxID=51671 RepID=UPI00356178EB
MPTCDPGRDSLAAHVILGAQPFVERDLTLQNIGVAAQRPRRQPFPVRAGADNVARFLLGIAAKNPHFTVEERQFGEGLGLVFRDGGRVHSVMNLHVEDGVIDQLWIVLNPAKLTHWRLHT